MSAAGQVELETDVGGRRDPGETCGRQWRDHHRADFDWGTHDGAELPEAEMHMWLKARRQGIPRVPRGLPAGTRGSPRGDRTDHRTEATDSSEDCGDHLPGADLADDVNDDRRGGSDESSSSGHEGERTAVVGRQVGGSDE